MVYEGELLPAEYRGAVLEVDAGTRQVNFFPITRKGASFRTDYKVFLGSDDPWFRPVDACSAPDGSVFVADWYDAGVGGHAFSDQTTGRIYRVAPKGHKSTQAQARLRHGRRPDRRAQVAEHRHAGRRAAGADRAGQVRAGRDPRRGRGDAGRWPCPADRDVDRARALWTSRPSPRGATIATAAVDAC